MQPIVLSDGLYLPSGTDIGMTVENIANDPSVVPDAETFDPWRSYRARQQPGEGSKHRFSMATANNLHFGLGTQACPGRYIALALEKMILAAMLVGWDIRFPKGQPIPNMFTLDDFCFIKPGSKIEVRRREVPNVLGSQPD